MSKQLTKKQSTLKRIFACIRPYTPLVLLSLLFSVITVALTLYVPILTGHGVDFILSKGNVNFHGLISIITTILTCIVISALCQWVMNHINNKITYKIVRDLRVQAFNHLQVLPLSYVDSHASGDLISVSLLISTSFLMVFTWIYPAFYRCHYNSWNNCIYAEY